MDTIQVTMQVDARGLQCPMPIIHTARAIGPLPSGAVVEVLATEVADLRARPS